jgi:parallel beta-helix repeat protein
MKVLLPLLVVLIATSLTAPASAQCSYIVRPDGTGDFPTIQGAVDVAQYGDVICLADGVFTGAGNRDIDYLGKAIVIRSQSGNPDACTIDCEGSQSEPHRAFLFHGQEGTQSVLDGVTITGGYGEWGGGINCYNSAPRIMNCIFIENTSTGSGSGRGGAIYLQSSSPAINACRFVGNSAEAYGGGVCCEVWSSPSIVLCTFAANSATWGGGICCRWNSSPTIDQCNFTAHSAYSGGGVAMHYDCFPTLTGCTLWNNAATYGAGGGGGIAVASSSPTLQNCTLAGNSDGMSLQDGSSPVLESTIIAFSTLGGGLVACNNSPSLTCCDIYGNVGGDWTPCIAELLGRDGNITEDPLFCGADNDDFTIRSDSPCAPFSPPNEECELIGAHPVGCSPPVPTVETSWGAIKAHYK